MINSMSNRPKPRLAWRTATTLSTAIWLVTSQLAGCGLEAEHNGDGSEEVARNQHAIHGAGGEGEGGEGASAGQGGEGEGATIQVAEFAADDIAYLTQLGLIRGHLAVGYALYQQGLPDLAETHMQHPHEEIYLGVEPAFAARGCEGFAEELRQLTGAVISRVPMPQVDAAYARLATAIKACERSAASDDPGVITGVIENLLHTAGVEYQIGVIDGRINNLHEYQDAWGFTQIAVSLTRSTAFANDPRAQAVAAQLENLIAHLQSMWPSLNPPGPVEGEAAQLFGAAGRTEIIGLALVQ